MTKVMGRLQCPFCDAVLRITENDHCFPQRFFTGYGNDSSRSQYFEKTSNYPVTSGISTAALCRHPIRAWPGFWSQLPVYFLSLGSHFFKMFSVSGVLSHDPLGLAHHFTTEKKKSFHCVVMGKPSLPAGELVNPRPESLNCSGGINVFRGSLGGDWYPNHRKPEL